MASKVTRKMKPVKGRTGPLTKQAFESMLNARREKKYFTLNDEDTVPVNGVVTPIIQGIIQGDTAITRDGNQLDLVKISIRLQLALNTSTNTDWVRFIVFSDGFAAGSLPSVAQVLEAADPNASYTREVVVTHRFKIWHDVILPMCNSGSNKCLAHIKDLPMRHKVTYLGATDATGSNGKNAMYYLLCGDEPTNLTLFNLDMGLSFYDS
jgi:hypothetical protein